MAAFLLFALALAVMFIAESLPPEARRPFVRPAVMTAALGFYVSTLSALRGYGHWGVRRLYEVGISPPSVSQLREEERRASAWAGAMVGAVILAIIAMIAVPIRGWTAVVVSGLFLAACAAGVHFFQVSSVVRTLEPYCTKEE